MYASLLANPPLSKRYFLDAYLGNQRTRLKSEMKEVIRQSFNQLAKDPRVSQCQRLLTMQDFMPSLRRDDANGDDQVSPAIFYFDSIEGKWIVALSRFFEEVGRISEETRSRFDKDFITRVFDRRFGYRKRWKPTA